MTSIWENVILSWVNLCNLSSEPVKKTEDLRDGKLLSAILPYDKTQAEGEYVQKIWRFVDRCYPDYGGKKATSLNNNDIICVSSLLMHYYSFCEDACIRNKMCNLDNESQIKIKAFLELFINKPVTKSRILNAIQSCCGDKNSKASDVYGETPKSVSKVKSTTPLQDFLNSPVARQQRKSEVMILKAELETERFRSNDLEDQLEELRRQKDAMETKKNEELRALRETLWDVRLSDDEDTVEPLNTSSTFLNSKIVDLRKLNDNLHDKCSNLQDENYELNEKVNLLANQVSEWKKKSHNFEEMYCDTQEKLESKLKEFAILMEELVEMREDKKNAEKNKTDLDTTGEWDYFELLPATVPAPAHEELASTVIELKLQEKESLIDNLEVTVSTLKRELETLCEEKINLENLNQEQQKQMNEKDSKIEVLLEKLESANTVLKEKDESVKNIHNNLEAVQNKLACEIEALQQKVRETEKELSKAKGNIEGLTLKLQTAETVCQQKQNTISSLQETFQSKENTLSSQINDLENEVQNYVSKVKELEKQLLSLMESHSTKTLELEKCEELNSKFQCEVKELRYIIDCRDLELSEFKEKLKTSQLEVHNHLGKIAHLEQELESVENHWMKECNSLREDMTQKCEEINQKDLQIAQYAKESFIMSERIEKSHSKIIAVEEELSNVKTKFSEESEMLKVNLLAKDKEILERKSEIDILNDKLNFICKELEKKQGSLKQCEEDLAVLKETECCLCGEISKLKEEIDSKNYQIVQKTEEIQSLADNVKMMDEKCSEKELQIKEREENWVSVRGSLLQEKKLLEDECKMKKEEIVHLLDKIKLLNEDCNRKECQCQDLDKEILSLRETVHSVQSTLTSQIDALKNEINSRISIEEEQERRISLLTKELEGKTKDINNYEELKNSLKFRINELNEALCQKDIKLNVHFEKVNSLESILHSKENVIADLERELEHMKIEMTQLCVSLKEELALKTEEINKKNVQISNHMEVSSLSSQKLLEYQTLLTAIEKEYSDAKSRFDKECDILKTNILTKNKDLDEKLKEINILNEKINFISEDLNGKVISLKKSEEERENYVQECISLKEEIRLAMERLRQRELDVADHVKEESLMSDKINELQTEVETLKSKLSDTWSRFTETNEGLETKNEEIELQKKEINSLNEKITFTTKELEEKVKSLKECEEDRDNSVQECESLNKEIRLTMQKLRQRDSKIADHVKEESLMSKKINELQTEVDTLKKELADTLSRFSEENEALKTALIVKSKEIEQQEKEMNSLNDKINCIDYELKQKIYSLEKCQEERDNLKEECTSLKEEVKLKFENISQKEAEIAHHIEEASLMLQKLSEFQVKINFLETEFSDAQIKFREESENLRSDLIAKESEIDDKSKEISTLNDKISFITEELQDKQVSLQKFEDNLTEVEDTKSSLLEVVAKLKEEIDSKNNQILRKTEEIYSLAENVKLMDQKCSERDLQIRETEETLASVRGSLLEEKKFLQDECEAKNKEIAELLNRIKLLIEDCSQKECQCQDLNNEIHNLQETVRSVKSSLSEQIDCLQEEMKIKGGKINELERNLTTAVDTLQKKEKNLGEYQEIENKLKKDVMMLEETLNLKDLELRDSSSKIRSLESSINDNLKTMAGLETELKALREHSINECALLKDEIKMMNEKLSQKETEIGCLVNETTEMSEKIIQYQIDMDGLNNELSQIQSKFSEESESSKANLMLKSKETEVQKEEINYLNNNITELKEEINEKNIALNGLEENLIKLQNKESLLTEETNQLKEEIALKDRELDQKSEKIISLTDKLKLMEHLYSEKELQIKKSEETFASIRDSLMNENSRLHVECETKNNEITNLLDSTYKFTHDLDSLRRTIAEKEEVIAIMTDDVANCDEKIKELQCSIQEKEDCILQLQNKMKSIEQTLSQENECLKQEIESLKIIINEKKKEVTDISKHVIQLKENLLKDAENICMLEKSLEDNNSNLKNKEQVIGELRDLVKGKEMLVAQKEEEIRSLFIQMEELVKNAGLNEEKIQHLNGELKVVNDMITLKVADLQKDIEEKETKITNFIHQFDVLTEELKVKDSLLSEEKNKVEIISSELKFKNDLLFGHEKTISNLEKELDSIQNTFATENSSLKNLLSCNIEKIEEQVKQLSSLKNEVNCFKDDLINKEREISERDKVILDLRSIIKEQESKSTQGAELLKTTMVEQGLTMGELKLCKEECMKKEQKIQEFERSILNFQKIISCKDQLISEKEVFSTKLLKDMECVQIKLSEQQKGASMLQEKLESVQCTLSSECDSLKKLLLEKDLKITEKESALSLLENKLAEKESNLAHYIEEISKLSNEVETYVTTCKEKEDSIDTLKKELNDISTSFGTESLNMKQALVEMEAKLGEKGMKISSLEDEIANKNTMLMEKVEELSTLSKNIELMHEDSMEKQDTILKLLEDQKFQQSLHEQNDELKLVIASKESDIIKKMAVIEKLMQENKMHEDKCTDKEMKLSSLQREFSEVKKTSEEEKESLKAEILAKENQLHEKKDEIIDLLKKLSSLEECSRQKDETIQSFIELKASHKSLESENENLKRNIAESKTEVIQKDKIINDISKKAESLENELEEHKKKENDMLQKLQLLESTANKSENYQRLIAEKEEAAETVKGKYTELKVKYVEKLRECQSIKSVYEEKLAKLKQQMNSAYQEDLEKLRSQHLSAESEAEKNLRVYKEKVTQYHGNNVELRSQVWELSEKLLKLKEEKSSLELRYRQLSSQVSSTSGENRLAVRKQPVDRYSLQQRMNDVTPLEVLDVVDESMTCIRRRTTMSRRQSIPAGIGQAFPPEDEDGEEFNAKYLADMKAGRCFTDQEEKDRLTEFQYRNSLCPPHLKSSYPTFENKDLLQASEECVKFGISSDHDNFDTLSTSYLLPDRKKNKDRGQTSYKKPGPPTPGKNGGRLSLQGSESGMTPHSVLKEQNDNSLSRKGVTPSRLRLLFSGKANRRDENSPVTPRTRGGLGFFRKNVKTRNQP